MSPRWGHWDIVPRAKPRGTYTHKTLVWAPLDEQLASRVHPERSRGVGLLGCRPSGAANHFSDDFSAAHNAWQTCAWMSTRADDIEIGNIFREIMRTEPCGLGENWFYAECITEMRIERVTEIGRCDIMFADNMLG